MTIHTFIKYVFNSLWIKLPVSSETTQTTGKQGDASQLFSDCHPSNTCLAVICRAAGSSHSLAPGSSMVQRPCHSNGAHPQWAWPLAPVPPQSPWPSSGFHHHFSRQHCREIRLQSMSNCWAASRKKIAMLQQACLRGCPVGWSPVLFLLWPIYSLGHFPIHCFLTNTDALSFNWRPPDNVFFGVLPSMRNISSESKFPHTSVMLNWSPVGWYSWSASAKTLQFVI